MHADVDVFARMAFVKKVAVEGVIIIRNVNEIVQSNVSGEMDAAKRVVVQYADASHVVIELDAC